MERDAEAEEDLRATSDAIESDAERLNEIEESKQGLDAIDPQMAQLSKDAVEVSERISRNVGAEHQLTEQVQTRSGRQGST